MSEKCIELVMPPPHAGYIPRPCHKPAFEMYEGKPYCKLHHPEEREKRRLKRGPTQEQQRVAHHVKGAYALAAIVVAGLSPDLLAREPGLIQEMVDLLGSCRTVLHFHHLEDDLRHRIQDVLAKLEVKK